MKRAVVLFALLMSAQAQAARVALIVGQNAGTTAAEQTLRYAEEDARRLKAVLEELGNFDRVELSLGINAASLLAQLARLSGELRDPQTLFFFYYSGHAGAGALHMAGTVLSGARLIEALEALNAQVTVAVLDACQSGVLTRPKGMRAFAAPGEAGFVDEKTVGLALLASSSATEAAQESELLKGSFFTSHLVTGLRGAADQNGDGMVGLSEVYSYAYDRTVKSTLISEAGVQHPTYRLKLTGRRDVQLTWPSQGASHLRLQARSPGRFVVLSKGEGTVLAELLVKDVQRERKIALSAGDYVIKKRAADGLFVARVRLDSNEDALLEETDMQRVPYATLRKKGEGPQSELIVSGLISTGLAGVPMLGGFGLGYLWELGPVGLWPSIEFAMGLHNTPAPGVTLLEGGGGLGAVFRMKSSRISAIFGLRPSVSLVHQRIERAPSRSAATYSLGALVGLDAWLWDRSGLTGWLESGGRLARVLSTEGAPIDWRGLWFLKLHVGWKFK